MSSGPPAGGSSEPPPAEDYRKHLDFIQTTIGRMSSAAALVKGWALTVATATYGYAGTKDSIPVALIGIGAVLLFGYLDARYLRQEKQYRALYDAARRNEVELYELDAATYCATRPKEEATAWGWRKVVGSWSVRDFYGVIVFAGLLVLIWAVLWTLVQAIACRP